MACPRATLPRISSAGLVQTKGSGLSLRWETQQSIRVSSSVTEMKLVLVKALRLSNENQDYEVELRRAGRGSAHTRSD